MRVVEQSIQGVCMYVGDGVKDVRVSSNEKADVSEGECLRES